MNLLLPVVLWLQLALLQLVGPVPADLGVHNGALSPCPAPAHCARANWRVDDADAALNKLVTAVASTPRTTVVEQRDRYLHATVSSAIFGFVDDLELFADPGGAVLQARSVSRLGDSDLGVNSRRLAALETLIKG